MASIGRSKLMHTSFHLKKKKKKKYQKLRIIRKKRKLEFFVTSLSGIIKFRFLHTLYFFEFI